HETRAPRHARLQSAPSFHAYAYDPERAWNTSRSAIEQRSHHRFRPYARQASWHSTTARCHGENSQRSPRRLARYIALNGFPLASNLPKLKYMADKDHLILTAVGPDQVGLIEKVSQFIARHGCNIEDSKMAVFCGEFALILLISGESGSLVKIANDHTYLEVETGLTISIKTPATRKPAESFLPYQLTASCMDHPGIVYRLSGVLSS